MGTHMGSKHDNVNNNTSNPIKAALFKMKQDASWGHTFACGRNEKS